MDYVRGKGYGKRPPEKICVQQVDLEASMASTMGTAKKEEQGTSELLRKLEEELARMDIQVGKRTQVKMDAFMIRMQQMLSVSGSLWFNLMQRVVGCEKSLSLDPGMSLLMREVVYLSLCN
uniref:Uncharacterized protein n=1 Tax=Solanum lycopersicum TaxID=4081 RepID=A0A3Q7H044_SOLLC